ncbi:MAG: radical SAM protein [Thermodesulfobacteriota bacterium]
MDSPKKNLLYHDLDGMNSFGTIKVILTRRKGRILNPTSFGCLIGIPAINITKGCLFRCAYCYARGYSQTPKTKEVHLYENLPDLLREEISRKKILPLGVILNTSSDCFQTHPEILKITYQTIHTLLSHLISVSFLTKGIIPKQFFDLFAQYPNNIYPQIGIVSLSEEYWKKYESETPHPEERLKQIDQFRRIGICPEVRIDPIIPFVTDRDEEASRLFKQLRESGVKKATLSYLHLRPFIQKIFFEELSPRHQKLIEACFRLQEWRQVGSSTKTKLLPKSIREKGYDRFKRIAESYGIQTGICQCKNPDLQGDLCSSSRDRFFSERKKPVQMPLFQCG